MHEDTELAGVQGTAGISRRDMLRKSAVVGGAGALMWAAPSITKFGSSAFGQDNGTPAFGLSNFGALVYCTTTDTTYKIKGDLVGDEFVWSVGDELGQCGNTITGWDTAQAEYGPDLGVSFTQSGDTYTMVLDPGQTAEKFGDCTFVFDNGVAAAIQEGTCCHFPTETSPTSLQWEGPFRNQPGDDDCGDNATEGSAPGGQ